MISVRARPKRVLTIACRLLAAGASFAVCACGRAQDAPAHTTFERLFPHPTGRNGNEELVAAGDLLRMSTLLQDVQTADPPATLAEKRAALNDPPVKRALEMLRAGLAKPRVPIHDKLDSETTFPEFALFRNEARTLVIEQYVRLADGDVPGAIESIRDTLRLGQACGTETLIAGLVRVAIDTIAIRLIADHLGQLSARDCDRLIALVREWLSLPDPSIEILDGERRFLMQTWEKCRANPESLLQHISEIDQPDEAGAVDPKAAAYRKTVEDIASNRAGYAALIDAIEATTAAQFNAQIANLRRPPWERQFIPEDSGDSLPGYLAGTLNPALNRIPERFDTERASIQLLGLHAAIHRYLWEHDSLPERIEDVHARALQIDPFSGKPFVYKKTGPRLYELNSVGPHKTNDSGIPIRDERVPLFLPPRRA